jgi:hypothetical protein
MKMPKFGSYLHQTLQGDEEKRRRRREYEFLGSEEGVKLEAVPPLL